VMPKCARIVPTISEATTTLTKERVRRLSILPPSRAKTRADSWTANHSPTAARGHAERSEIAQA
jgi:hypothetical protein